jgi:hypothetical protein
MGGLFFKVILIVVIKVAEGVVKNFLVEPGLAIF